MSMRVLPIMLCAGLALAGVMPLEAQQASQTPPPSAQPQTAMNCAERDAIVEKLAVYQEEAEAIGLNKDGTLLEVFVSPQGTWTVLLSSPQGQSCIAAIGEGWELKATSQRPET